MKKFLAILMLWALVLCAACSRQPETPETPDVPEQPTQQEQQTPETPETPEVPEVPETPDMPVVPEAPQTPEVPEVPESPEAPETPTVPEAPKVVEPEGYDIVTKLPAKIPMAEQVADFLPLQDGVSVLLAKSGEKAWLMTYDYTTDKIIHQLEVTAGAEAELAYMTPGSVYYLDGQTGWDVTISEQLELSLKEYDIRQRLKMGDKEVTGLNGSILVDGKVALEAQPSRDAYVLVGILDDHRLLYNAYSAATNLDGTYGIYDHTTGEKKLLTTMGQYVVGVWGDTLLIARQTAGGWYELGKYDLTDYSFTSLNIGHEKIDRRVEHILCNDAGSRLMVTWEDNTGLHVQIFDLETQEELYAWTAPAGEDWNFRLTGNNGLAVWKGSPDDLTVWSVNY